MHPNATEKVTEYNVIDDLKDLPLEELKAVAKARSLPFAVALANVTGDLNTGMVIRTSCVLGAEKVFIFGKRKYDRRATVGAHHYIDVEAYTLSRDEGQTFDWDEMLRVIRINGYTPVLIEQGGTVLSNLTSSLIEEIGQVCLVFGAEDMGIPANVCATEQCFSIPQIGIIRSLNVSAAASIAIHHVASTYVR